MSRSVEVRPSTLEVLKKKKLLTGRSYSELLEYAVHTMPYIAPKKKKKR